MKKWDKHVYFSNLMRYGLNKVEESMSFHEDSGRLELLLKTF